MTQSTSPPAPKARRQAMVRIPGGAFRMGSVDFYPDEQPVRSVDVDPFWMDPHPVTVAEFRRFIKATGYVTTAECTPEPGDYPGADLTALVPGALVFCMTQGPVRLDDWHRWWSYVPGADWRHPLGPGSTLHGRELHPVTQVSFSDAAAYAAWAGKDLPTEAEWEYAARGGLDGAVFCWGEEFMPKGRVMANTWHGEFPWQYRTPRRSGPDTSPVRTYPPNGYGLFDMAGNVWEWTRDLYTVAQPAAEAPSCCAPTHVEATDRFPRRVTKGGSHLCAPNYCLRYRPAARQGQTEDTSTCHLGFRCVLRDPSRGV